jgi:hypothetical protein
MEILNNILFIPLKSPGHNYYNFKDNNFNNYTDENLIKNILKYNFCIYINKKGKNSKLFCSKKIRENKSSHVYCHFHRYRYKNNIPDECNVISLQNDVYGESKTNYGKNNEHIKCNSIVKYTKNNEIIKKMEFIFNQNIYKYIDIEISKKFYNYIHMLFYADNSNIIKSIHKKVNIISNDSPYRDDDISEKKLKKYLKNKKKRNKAKIKKLMDKNKPDLKYDEQIINVNKLNDECLIKNIDCGYMSIKKWSLNYESYKSFSNNNKILYFHNYYYNFGVNQKQVTIFYINDNNEIIPKNITYGEFYNLFIIEFNKKSTLDYIRYYYKNFKP